MAAMCARYVPHSTRDGVGVRCRRPAPINVCVHVFSVCTHPNHHIALANTTMFNASQSHVHYALIIPFPCRRCVLAVVGGRAFALATPRRRRNDVRCSRFVHSCAVTCWFTVAGHRRARFRDGIGATAAAPCAHDERGQHGRTRFCVYKMTSFTEHARACIMHFRQSGWRTHTKRRVRTGRSEARTQHTCNWKVVG